MENKMESSIFVLVPIEGVFQHNKEKQPGLIASTVGWKSNSLVPIECLHFLEDNTSVFLINFYDHTGFEFVSQ